MSNRLAGKVAVVTGGSSGIGLATAKRFAAEGAHVFITGRRKKELEAAAAEIGRNSSAVLGDVANLADLDRLYEAVRKQKGRLDVLFANAGMGEHVPLGEITEEHFDRTFDANEAMEEFKTQMSAQVPLGRMGAPEEIASAALFLATDESSYITGVELFVDGGMGQV